MIPRQHRLQRGGHVATIDLDLGPRAGAQERADDEMSVCSATIRDEVNRFALSANVTQNNLGRLERRLQAKAKG